MSNDVSGSDGAAIAAAQSSALDGFTKLKLIAGSMEPLASTTNPPALKICLQLGKQTWPSAATGMTSVSVPERLAALILCDPNALQACQTELVTRLGNDWKGLLYVVPVLQWLKNGNRVGQPPSRKLLALTAAGLDATTEPDPESSLQQTDLLLVAPAPDGVTEDDLQKKMKPTASP